MKYASISLISVFFSIVIVLCLIASFRFITIESTIALLLFNLLFALLTFGLNGTLTRKLGILALGNVIGLFWNSVLCVFSIAGSVYFGAMFNAVYQIFRPFLNFIWIVSFWSMSLPAFPKVENQR